MKEWMEWCWWRTKWIPVDINWFESKISERFLFSSQEAKQASNFLGWHFISCFINSWCLLCIVTYTLWCGRKGPWASAAAGNFLPAESQDFQLWRRDRWLRENKVVDTPIPKLHLVKKWAKRRHPSPRGVAKIETRWEPMEQAKLY